MAGSDLTSGYLEQLRRVLPAGIAEEIEGGLADARAHYLACGYSGREAAEAAIAEFGDPQRLAAELTRHAPGRRCARLLLATGPLVGACWAAVLITARAWTWPVPPAVRIAFAAALLTAVALLAVAAIGIRSYQRTRLAVPGGIALIILDAVAVAALLAAVPSARWTALAAVTASITRIAGTARWLGRAAAR